MTTLFFPDVSAFQAGISLAGAPAVAIKATEGAGWTSPDYAPAVGRARMAGAFAIVTTGTLLARAHWLNFLRYCGEHSIVIYLAFFLPMAITRTLLLRTGVIPDIGLISLVVTIAGVTGALAIWRVAIALRANFLFERPQAFWIAPRKPRAKLQPAE